MQPQAPRKFCLHSSIKIDFFPLIPQSDGWTNLLGQNPRRRVCERHDGEDFDGEGTEARDIQPNFRNSVRGSRRTARHSTLLHNRQALLRFEAGSDPDDEDALSDPARRLQSVDFTRLQELAEDDGSNRCSLRHPALLGEDASGRSVTFPGRIGLEGHPVPATDEGVQLQPSPRCQSAESEGSAVEIPRKPSGTLGPRHTLHANVSPLYLTRDSLMTFDISQGGQEQDVEEHPQPRQEQAQEEAERQRQASSLPLRQRA